MIIHKCSLCPYPDWLSRLIDLHLCCLQKEKCIYLAHTRLHRIHLLNVCLTYNYIYTLNLLYGGARLHMSCQCMEVLLVGIWDQPSGNRPVWSVLDGPPVPFFWTPPVWDVLSVPPSMPVPASRVMYLTQPMQLCWLCIYFTEKIQNFNFFKKTPKSVLLITQQPNIVQRPLCIRKEWQDILYHLI